MKTQHNIYTGLAQDMSTTPNSSVDLVVTSPPYPMIEMWDEIMGKQNTDIAEALKEGDGKLSFELMHQELDKVWQECFRVLKDGGIACINIGDATRTINGEFALYPNHSRIITACINSGFINLPNIIWRKRTNAPNKFMGSGMLPAGAYVTLEHEWILVFRKGGKREFKKDEDKVQRRVSSFFWEERNIWFSDLWEIKGTKQNVTQPQTRSRSAAYPLEIPFRLINMYSLQGDTVLDPFMGTGTTALSAILCNRNSVGYDVDSDFTSLTMDNIRQASTNRMNEAIHTRIQVHSEFIEERLKTKEVKHFNENFSMPVMTKQETGMKFYYVSDITVTDNNTATASYVEKKDADLRSVTKQLHFL